MELQNINYSYLSGALSARLKHLVSELDAAGLLKKNALQEAEAIALRALAEAEQAERKFTKGA